MKSSQQLQTFSAFSSRFEQQRDRWSDYKRRILSPCHLVLRSSLGSRRLSQHLLPEVALTGF